MLNFLITIALDVHPSVNSMSNSDKHFRMASSGSQTYSRSTGQFTAKPLGSTSNHGPMTGSGSSQGTRSGSRSVVRSTTFSPGRTYIIGTNPSSGSAVSSTSGSENVSGTAAGFGSVVRSTTFTTGSTHTYSTNQGPVRVNSTTSGTGSAKTSHSGSVNLKNSVNGWATLPGKICKPLHDQIYGAPKLASNSFTGSSLGSTTYTGSHVGSSNNNESVSAFGSMRSSSTVGSSDTGYHVGSSSNNGSFSTFGSLGSSSAVRSSNTGSGTLVGSASFTSSSVTLKEGLRRQMSTILQETSSAFSEDSGSFTMDDTSVNTGKLKTLL